MLMQEKNMDLFDKDVLDADLWKNPKILKNSTVYVMH